MSEIRANKIAALGADIQFWTGAPTEKLRIDATGNLCFGDVGSAGAHIPPPDGIAPMYSARAWGRIIANASGVIQYNLSKTNNINMSLFGVDATRWEYGNPADADMRLEVRFLKALPSEYYTVVASCNLSASAPLLVARANSANSPATTTGFGLTVYNAGGTGGTGYLPNPITSGFPELIEFVVFA